MFESSECNADKLCNYKHLKFLPFLVLDQAESREDHYSRIVPDNLAESKSYFTWHSEIKNYHRFL